ncbi:hypothetical protein PQ610_03045 [Tardisphaera miroshnichenkoae]
MRTGFDELDEVIADDWVVEFFSVNARLLFSFYHRAIVESAPVNVLVVGERGGLDPYLLIQIARAIGRGPVEEELVVRRAFKAEDVPPSIESFEGELVVIDPYHHGRLQDRVASAIKEREGRTFLFSFGDRRRFGSAFGWHVASSVIELREVEGGFKARVVKSPSHPEVELAFSSVFWRGEEGLSRWLSGG